MALRVASQTRPIDAPEPWALLAESDTGFWDAGEVRVWQGCAVELIAHGPTRFEDIRRQADALGLDDARFYGGFAFHGGPAVEPWRGFPAARFVLPEREVVWRDGVATETTHEASPVGPEHQDEAAGPTRPDTDKPRWHRAVEAALDAIDQGDATKVVLSRCQRGPPTDPVRALERLSTLEPVTTRFLMRGGGAAFFGATPETLVRLDDRVRTHALAGTAPAGDASLMHSSKDLLEHELVVTYLRGRLESAGVTDMQQGRRRLRRMRHVQHLETPLEGDAPGRHVLDLVAALHPTPAVCGLPPRRSQELIRSLEGYPRGWYSGAVGWFDARGRGEFAVALRSALATAEATWLFAGAGIVPGSDPAAEWDETARKLLTLEELL